MGSVSSREQLFCISITYSSAELQFVWMCLMAHPNPPATLQMFRSSRKALRIWLSHYSNQDYMNTLVGEIFNEMISASDLPSATRKRSSQDAKGRNKRDNDPGEQAHGTYSTPPEATSENRPERPHCRHHHHHHHCVQQTANSTGKRPKQIFWHMSQLLRDSAAPLASRFGWVR